MEKTRFRGERALIAIAAVAIIVCVIGIIAIVLTPMAPWAFYMTVGSLSVAAFVCIVGTEIYGYKNNPAAGVATRHELTIEPPNYRLFGSCPKCDFPQPPPIRWRREGSQETQYVYCDYCSHCGSPLGKHKPPEPRRVTEGYNPDEIKRR